MKRFYRLFISLLIIVGIVAVAPAVTVDTKSDLCITSAGSCGDDLVFADADTDAARCSSCIWIPTYQIFRAADDLSSSLRCVR